MGTQIHGGAAGLAEILETLRSLLRQRLDALEALVRAGDPQEESGQVRSLRERLRLAEQWKQDHLEEAAQLEQERAQLADAWERLEREQTRSTSRPRAETPRQPAAAAVPREMENPVSQALLLQFKELQCDVKRHAASIENHTDGKPA